MRLVALVVLSAATLACHAAAPPPELGELNGAQFRIDMPENWNGTLVVYCHGYNPTPVTFKNGAPDPLSRQFLERGYAMIQSGYAAGGWAIEEAVADTQALRRYFVKKHGAPKETYVTGHSMGGFLTMYLVESFPNDFDAGLPLCGPLAPATFFMTRQVFDPLVLFAYYYPGVLPDPGAVPADYAMSAERVKAVLEAIAAKPDRAEAMRRYMGIRNNQELAGTVAFFTYIAKELAERAGGNPFDNRNTVYNGTLDDAAVNVQVKRYTPDARAAEYLRTWATPTGRLTRPMLAVNNLYDQLVPSSVPNTYSLMAGMAGAGDWFVQQYVTGPGHCNITAPQTITAFEQLRAWKQKGERPKPGLRE